MKPKSKWVEEYMTMIGVDDPERARQSEPDHVKQSEDFFERIQNDARKDGLMSAIGLASETIALESPKYATGKPEEGANGQNALSGLQYKVSSAILAEADKIVVA